MNTARPNPSTTLEAALVIRITYDLAPAWAHDEGCTMEPDTIKAALLRHLDRLPQRLSDDGMLSCDHPCEVDTWSQQVLTLTPADAHPYRHFKDREDVRSYIFGEFLATLTDDYGRMCGSERMLHTEADRTVMANRLADVKRWMETAVIAA